jgi:hypothetical protein
VSRPERLDLVTLMSRIETTHGRLVPPDGPYVLIADIYEAFGEGATYASIRDAVLRREPCPIRSSITDQPCLEPAGHPQWSEGRFHHYDRIVEQRRHDPADHDCRGGVPGDRFPL